MSAINIIKAYAKKSLTKNRGSGIMELPSDMVAESRAGEIAAMLQRAGIPVEQLDQFIRSEKDLVKYLNIIEATSKPNYTVYSGQEAADQLNKFFPPKGEVLDMTGKKIDTSQGIMGGKSVKELMESGQVQKGTQGLKKSDKVVQREMFEEANKRFNETENFVTNTITKITSMEPVAAMKEANKIVGRKGAYKNLTEEQSQKILKDTDDWIFQRDLADRWDYNKNRPFRDDPDFDPDDPAYLQRMRDEDAPDYATGGRAGYYTGGIADVEPKLDDIGHGSDSLMSRTRLVSPNNQATTSTGLNYLLAEDNDNIRVPFFKGGDAGRRAFLKWMATLGGGIAGLKSGLFGLGGKEATKKAVTETIKQSAGSGTTPPPYFFKLVEKIKTLGDDATPSKDKAIAKTYKDYVMEEDFAGNIEIKKTNYGMFGDEIAPTEEVYMSYRVDEVPLKGKKGSTKVEEYDEYTARPDEDGKMKDVEDGVPDDVVMEVEAGSGNVPESFYTGPDKIKKADGGRIGFAGGKGVGGDLIDRGWDEENLEHMELILKLLQAGEIPQFADGGRIGFSGGNLAKFLASKKITGSSRTFLEKVFGKERFENMIRNDPEMHRGMLEVVEMFRKKDKEGLKMYLQKFLPHMDDATIEDFIIGSGGTEGIEGQLIRLGSGRDYAGKIKMIKDAENMRTLDKLDVDKMKPNAEGGLITMLGE